MTMSQSSHHSKAGFTLIELVIVLGITGLIFSGLWGLLTSGSSQLQAQAAAQQYRQVIEATRKYITSDIAPYQTGQAAGPVATPPTVADLIAANLLSANFSDKDSYGNTIKIAVDTIDASKQQWKFSVYSSGTGLSDKIGAQVSSLIGSEGGFVYSNATDGCVGAVNATACGSFNSFTLPLSDFGIANGTGRIVTLAYTVDTNAGTAPWLYRKAGITPEQNTMSQSMFFNNGLSLSMQGSSIVTGNGSISMGNAVGATTGATGILYMGNSDIANLRNITGQNSTMTFNSLTVTTDPSGNDITMQSHQNLVLQSVSGTFIQSPSGAAISPQDTIVLTVYGGARFYNLESLKFIYSSDERLKKNIVPLEDSLKKIMMLKGHAFEWKRNDEKTIGLIAQEVQAVYPELVNKGTDGMLGVDYGKLIAPVIEAIKELKKENDELKVQVQELKASIKR
ncbi:MAG: tail fiber domain-containing protein [Alphaproteobacteria bacterium]|nr:tail fiber domain-containing protein [Alphaproteobacteria bacterium]